MNETTNTAHKLESFPESQDLDIEGLLKEYRRIYPDRPLWRMVEDIQQQAMLYTNIIELLKSGKQASMIRGKFEALDLIPPNILPNPNMPALLTKAFNKVSQYRKALVEIIRRYGGELLNELSFEVGLTVSVGVDVGFPPSIMIAVEHTATVQEVRKY